MIEAYEKKNKEIKINKLIFIKFKIFNNFK